MRERGRGTHEVLVRVKVGRRRLVVQDLAERRQVLLAPRDHAHGRLAAEALARRRRLLGLALVDRERRHGRAHLADLVRLEGLGERLGELVDEGGKVLGRRVLLDEEVGQRGRQGREVVLVAALHVERVVCAAWTAVGQLCGGDEHEGVRRKRTHRPSSTRQRGSPPSPCRTAAGPRAPLPSTPPGRSRAPVAVSGSARDAGVRWTREGEGRDGPCAPAPLPCGGPPPPSGGSSAW